jgi:TolB protein
MTVQEKQEHLDRTGPLGVQQSAARWALALGVASVLGLGACHIHMSSTASTPSASRASSEASSTGAIAEATRLSPPAASGDDAPEANDVSPRAVENATDPRGNELAPTPLRRPYHDLQRHTFRSIGEDTGIDVSPDGESIAYSSTQDSDYPKVYVKEHNSALVRSITTGRFRDIHPKFSPDGRWIAFASDREGSFDIWLTSLGKATVSEQITYGPEDDVHPTFSPDGTQIAFCRRSPRQGWNLWVQHRTQQSVTELGPGLFPEWSPSGEWITFQKPSERGEHWYGIWVIRPDGSEVRRVVALDHSGAIQPSWSPTGEQIVFTTVVRRQSSPDWDGNRTLADDISIMDLCTGRLFQLTQHDGSNWSPSWGLNGRIYFTSDRHGGRNLLSLVPPEVADI